MTSGVVFAHDTDLPVRSFMTSHQRGGSEGTVSVPLLLTPITVLVTCVFSYLHCGLAIIQITVSFYNKTKMFSGVRKWGLYFQAGARHTASRCAGKVVFSFSSWILTRLSCLLISRLTACRSGRRLAAGGVSVKIEQQTVILVQLITIFWSARSAICAPATRLLRPGLRCKSQPSIGRIAHFPMQCVHDHRLFKSQSTVYVDHMLSSLSLI